MKNPLDRPGATEILATMNVGRVTCIYPRFRETPRACMVPRLHYAHISTCGALELKGEKGALQLPPGVILKGIIVVRDLTLQNT